jgi:hypothetical protein
MPSEVILAPQSPVIDTIPSISDNFALRIIFKKLFLHESFESSAYSIKDNRILSIMKNILIPIGTSINAVSNLQYAIDLAQEMNAYVYVISVFNELSKVGELTK